MKYFASVSATSFTFSFAMWVIWSYFIMQANLNPSWDGSLIYLPHAARVLCVVYFGYKSIPALYLAEICGPLFFFPTIPDLQMLFLAMLSVLSVPFALFILSLMGFSLGNTRQSPLNRRYYRHITLIVMISAMFNAFGKVADVVQVARFFIGDMLGAATIIIILSITLKPLIAKPLRNSD